MKILISGASGFLGSALTKHLDALGHQVTPLLRGKITGAASGPIWDPGAAEIDGKSLDGFDSVVHLAGESISPPWTTAKMARIRNSRIDGTRLLCSALTSLRRRPRTLLCASGINYYGDRGEGLITEADGPGTGFLAEVCRDWEAACAAADSGIRVANLRLAMVVDGRGGAVGGGMAGLFRWGLGGRVGSGRQYWSWISLADAVEAFAHVLHDESLSGPLNVCSPQAVTNREFTRTLAAALHRPALLPLPAWTARLMLGSFGREVLLASLRAQPQRLMDSGFQFKYPRIEAAMAAAFD